MTLRFIGLESFVAGTRLWRFGQALTVSDEVADELVYGPNAKCAVLPDVEFQKIAFTSSELEKYQYPALHAEAPAEFLAKKQEAVARLAELRRNGPQVEQLHQEVAQ